MEQQLPHLEIFSVIENASFYRALFQSLTHHQCMTDFINLLGVSYVFLFHGDRDASSFVLEETSFVSVMRSIVWLIHASRRRISGSISDPHRIRVLSPMYDSDPQREVMDLVEFLEDAGFYISVMTNDEAMKMAVTNRPPSSFATALSPLILYYKEIFYENQMIIQYGWMDGDHCARDVTKMMDASATDIPRTPLVKFIINTESLDLLTDMIHTRQRAYLCNRIESLKHMHKSICKVRERLQVSHDTMKAEMTSFINIQSNLDTARIQMTSLKKELADIKKETSGIQAKIHATKKERVSANRKLSALETSLGEILSRIQETTLDRDSKEDVLCRTKSDVEDLDFKIIILLKTHRMISSRVQMIQNRVKEIELLAESMEQRRLKANHVLSAKKLSMEMLHKDAVQLEAQEHAVMLRLNSAMSRIRSGEATMMGMIHQTSMWIHHIANQVSSLRDLRILPIVDAIH